MFHISGRELNCIGSYFGLTGKKDAAIAILSNSDDKVLRQPLACHLPRRTVFDLVVTVDASKADSQNGVEHLVQASKAEEVRGEDFGQRDNGVERGRSRSVSIDDCGFH